jgi:hypothetical protein
MSTNGPRKTNPNRNSSNPERISSPTFSFFPSRCVPETKAIALEIKEIFGTSHTTAGRYRKNDVNRRRTIQVKPTQGAKY